MLAKTHGALTRPNAKEKLSGQIIPRVIAIEMLILPLIMTVDNSLLKTILHRVKSVCQPKMVILFGSAATGKMTADSDIDLLVIEPAAANPRKESVIIRQALRGLPHSFDIIVMSYPRFEETKNVIGGIAYPAHKYGKVIYEAA